MNILKKTVLAAVTAGIAAAALITPANAANKVNDGDPIEFGTASHCIIIVVYSRALWICDDGISVDKL